MLCVCWRGVATKIGNTAPLPLAPINIQPLPLGTTVDPTQLAFSFVVPAPPENTCTVEFCSFEVESPDFAFSSSLLGSHDSLCCSAFNGISLLDRLHELSPVQLGHAGEVVVPANASLMQVSFSGLNESVAYTLSASCTSAAGTSLVTYGPLFTGCAPFVSLTTFRLLLCPLHCY